MKFTTDRLVEWSVIMINGWDGKDVAFLLRHVLGPILKT